MPYCCNGQTRCSLLGSSPFGAQLAECIRQNPSLLSRTCRQLSVKFRLRYFFPVVACWCYFTPSYAACQDFFDHFDFSVIFLVLRTDFLIFFGMLDYTSSVSTPVLSPLLCAYSLSVPCSLSRRHTVIFPAYICLSGR